MSAADFHTYVLGQLEAVTGGQTRDGPDAGVDVADLETQGFPHHMENSLHDMYFTVRQLHRKT